MGRSGGQPLHQSGSPPRKWVISPYKFTCNKYCICQHVLSAFSFSPSARPERALSLSPSLGYLL